MVRRRMVLRVRGRRSSPARRHGYMRSAARLRRAPIPDRSSSAICGTTPKPAVSDTASSVAGTVSDVTSSAAQSVSDVVDDVTGAISDAAGAAADAVKGLLNSALDTLTSAFNAVVGKIGGAWDSVKTGVTKAVETAMQGAIGFLAGLGSLFGAVASALASLDVGVLKTAWAAVTGAAEAAVAGGCADRGGSHGDGRWLWAGLKEMAESAIGGLRSQAEGLIGHLPSAVQGAARSAWATIETADQHLANDQIGVDLAAHLGAEGRHRSCRPGRSGREGDQGRTGSRPSSPRSRAARRCSASCGR